jgi:ATP-dependent RNA helicase DDX41
MGVQELAHDIKYTEALRTSWRPPRYLAAMPRAKCDALRKKWHIIAEGEDVPPPIKSFQEMKFPKPIISVLRKRGIASPTPIQIQGLPVALSGRDMIGIAFTGSGKTMVFCLPMVMLALEQEKRMPFVAGEGPFCVCLSPSRELARQTHEQVSSFCDALEGEGFPKLRAALAMGGMPLKETMDVARNGIHIITCTPGRLIDMLNKRLINLDVCRYQVGTGPLRSGPCLLSYCIMG